MLCFTVYAFESNSRVNFSDKVVPIAGLQRIMVQTMNAANAVPHFGFCEEIVVDELVQVFTVDRLHAFCTFAFS
jgi:hypothetical protein